MKNFLMRFGSDEAGATAIEYALLAAFIALAIVSAATTLGGNVARTLGDVSAALK